MLAPQATRGRVFFPRGRESHRRFRQWAVWPGVESKSNSFALLASMPLVSPGSRPDLRALSRGFPRPSAQSVAEHGAVTAVAATAEHTVSVAIAAAERKRRQVVERQIGGVVRWPAVAGADRAMRANVVLDDPLSNPSLEPARPAPPADLAAAPARGAVGADRGVRRPARPHRHGKHVHARARRRGRARLRDDAAMSECGLQPTTR